MEHGVLEECRCNQVLQEGKTHRMQQSTQITESTWSPAEVVSYLGTYILGNVIKGTSKDP